jgi:hypothetical protein
MQSNNGNAGHGVSLSIRDNLRILLGEFLRVAIGSLAGCIVDYSMVWAGPQSQAKWKAQRRSQVP